MKIFYSLSPEHSRDRGSIFPLLKAFIKSASFTDAQRMEIYLISEKEVTFTSSLEEADIAVLPMSWNYYASKGLMTEALEFVKQCEQSNKTVWSWNAGDHGVYVPKRKNLIIFRHSGYVSKFDAGERGLPAFIGDPLKKYYKTEDVFILPYSEVPVVGFCGQAKSSLKGVAKQLAQIAQRNLMYYLKRSPQEPEALIPTTHLRASLLKRLEKSPLIKTNFIKRDQYRAGVTTGKASHDTTLEFYDNLKESAYILCVRGGGNFSVRFYEALAMGRIPIFVNTDSPLPFQNTVPWKEHVVWVAYKDRRKIAQLVYEFNQKHTPETFRQLQLDNRKLWEERLRMGGFFRHQTIDDRRI